MSFAPIGALPLSALPDGESAAEANLSAFELAEATRHLVLGVEVVAHDPSLSANVTSRLASHGFATEPDDEPANTVIEGVIPAQSGISFRESIPTSSDGFFGGLISRSFGEVIFANDQGELDALASRDVDGRRVVLRVGRLGDNDKPVQWKQWARVLEVRANSWTHGRKQLRLQLQDISNLLRIPLQRARYAGTGGEEGPESLKDRTKPVCLGPVRKVPLILLDEGLLLYGIHDAANWGALQEIEGIDDSGVRLDGTVETVTSYAALAGSVPEAGGYVQSLQVGMVRLGSPPAGQLTADVKGGVLDYVLTAPEPWSDGTYFDDLTGWAEGKTGPGYVDTLGGILLAILTYGARWGYDRIDRGSFINLDRVLPAKVAHYVGLGEEVSVADVIERLCYGCGCYAGSDNLGRFIAGQVAGPKAEAQINIDERQIVEIERINVSYRVAPLSISVGYGRQFVTQSPSELAEGLSLEEKQRLGERFSTAVVKDALRSVRNPTAREVGPIESPLAEREDAEDLAERLFDLYDPDAAAYRVTIKPLFAIKRGRTIGISHSRYGLSAGKNFVVTGVETDLDRRRTVLTVFG